MDTQTWIAIGIVAVAAWFVGRHLWGELEGLFRSRKAGHCASCNMCETGKAAGTRPAPEIKSTPPVTLRPNLPPHLEKLRAGHHEGTTAEHRP